MSYQPGAANLPSIQQNSSYDLVLRMTETFKGTTVNNVTSTFTSPCHGFQANDAIVFLNPNSNADYSVITASDIQSFTQSCKLKFNELYYVSSTDLTDEQFKVSTTAGGTPIVLGGTADTNVYLAARPLNIAGFTFDADICEASTASRIEVATFTTSIVTANQGTFRLSLTPAVTASMSPGSYAYDVSVTPPDGKRFYAMRGTIAVELTRSR